MCFVCDWLCDAVFVLLVCWLVLCVCVFVCHVLYVLVCCACDFVCDDVWIVLFLGLLMCSVCV